MEKEISNSLLLNSAIILSGVTALSCIAASSYYSTYLQNFGFSDNFVSLRVEDVIRVAVLILIQASFLYSFSSMLPRKMFSRLAQVAFVYPYLFFPALIFLLLYFFVGYAVLTGIALMFASVALVLARRERGKFRSAGLGFQNQLEEAAEVERRYRSWMLTHHIDQIPSKMFLVAAIFIITPAVSSAFGHFQSTRGRAYNIIESDTGTSALIYLSGAGALLVDLDVTSTHTAVVVDGSQRLLALSELSGERMDIRNIKIKRKRYSTFSRATFADFWRKWFGAWRDDWIP